MPTDAERKLYGPDLALIGRPTLEMHYVHSHTQQDATQSFTLRGRSRTFFDRISDVANSKVTFRNRKTRTQGFREKSAGPPEFFYSEIGGAHIFAGHVGVLAVIRGERVWAVTSAGVEVIK